MNLYKGMIVLLAILALVGCQSNEVKIDPTFRTSVKTVAIIASEQLPDEIFYMGSEHAFSAALGGTVGALIAQGASTTGQQIDMRLRQHVDMPSIYRSEFIEAFTKNNPHNMKLAPEAEADAVITLVITRYGFGKANAFASKLRPLVIGGIKIQSKSGNIIWKDGASVSPLNQDIYGTDIESYFRDPTHFESSLSSAFKSISEELVLNLNRT
ncbi:MAG: hypothetical protein RPU43_11995 [Candidatus Sedimenticola sp. (ex Thyasira tokunagai)]